MISSINSWSIADAGIASMGAWVVLGLSMGLAVGFMLGVSVAKFILHRRASDQLRLIEAMAKRQTRNHLDRFPKG